MRTRMIASLTRLAVALLAAAVPAAAASVRVLVDVPREAVSPGQIVEIPVCVEDGADDVLSYAFEVRYDPTVLRVTDIAGGTFEGFEEAPVTNPAGFERGRTRFTAINKRFLRTPSAFKVASIRFEVIGRPADTSAIIIRRVPRSEITVAGSFDTARRLRFVRGNTLTVK